jgi:YidC/Oxa1 family membrane protein insertase
MKTDNTRNTVIFAVCTIVILALYMFFVVQPQTKAREAARLAAASAPAAKPGADGVVGPQTTPTGAIFVTNRSQALGGAARVPIATPTLRGSLSLQGGRIDDLFLTKYRTTIKPDSGMEELFRPQGMEHAYFAQFGWTGIPGGVPGPNTVWSLTNGSTLTPTTPITLTWDNGQGLRFTRVVSIDDQYMFAVKDTVANLGTQAVTIAPYGRVERQGVPPALGKTQILHEGAIGTFSTADGKGYSTEQLKYKAWEKKPLEERDSKGGWLGITDKYWMAALIPSQDETVKAQFKVEDATRFDIHIAQMLGAPHTIQPGQTITEQQHLFAGAKRNEILSGYEKGMHLPRFIYAIDWGMLWFLTRPIFLLVEFFYGLVHNFGVAILLLTLTIKLFMFPLANKSYESLSKMRKLQPRMEAIKAAHKDDPAAQQRETMALYQTEKINPLAGCLPIVVQIPVFYSLYKVLYVTIEMRHAPFFGWIRDLSDRDPTNIWNLFGLIPWNPATAPLIGQFLSPHVGGGFTLALSVLAIIYGLTMWLQQAMNPPAPDPVQRQIFMFMPLIFTFIMASFPAGLLIYWAWNNILSILQQYIIMHRFKAENPIDAFFSRLKKAT